MADHYTGRLQFETDSGAADQREPQHRDQRRRDRQQHHHFANRAAARHFRDVDRHDRCVANKPAPVEERPGIEPLAIAAIHGGLREIDDVRGERLEKDRGQKLGRPERVKECGEPEHQPHVYLADKTQPFEAGDASRREDRRDRKNDECLRGDRVGYVPD